MIADDPAARFEFVRLQTTKQRFAAAADNSCNGAGSGADGDALLAACRDPETQAMRQRDIAARPA